MEKIKKFFRDENKAAKFFAVLTILGLFVVGNATGVFAAFFRTLSNGGLVSNVSTYQYGYGYGDFGYGYGYGYGQGYGDNGLSGYYYTAPTGGASDYTNATTVTASTISALSTIVGTPSAATSLTITAPAVFNPTGNIRVTLPTGLVITNASGGTLNTTALAAANLVTPTVSLGSDTLNGAMTFGVSGVKLNFSKPVKIEIPVSTSASTISIKVKHATDSSYTTSSLTSSATDTCTNGVAGTPSATATVSAGVATIYTCSASEFVAYTVASSGGGGGGGGGGIPSDNCPNGDTSGNYYDGKCTTTVTATGTTVSTSQSGVTVTVTTASGTTVTNFVRPAVVLTSLKDVKFTDISNNWAKNYIIHLVARGVINNTEKYNPDNNLTRAEFLKIAVNAAGWKTTVTNTTDFADVAHDAWYAPYVSLAASKGIVTKKNANFRPNDSISRAEAAKIIVGIFGASVTSTTTSFADVDASSDLAKYIETAKTLGFFSGQTIDGKLKFRPNDSITRAEIAKVVVNAFKL